VAFQGGQYDKPVAVHKALQIDRARLDAAVGWHVEDRLAKHGQDGTHNVSTVGAKRRIEVVAAAMRKLLAYRAATHPAVCFVGRVDRANQAMGMPNNTTCVRTLAANKCHLVSGLNGNADIGTIRKFMNA
jgi:hypothetical protein